MRWWCVCDVCWLGKRGVNVRGVGGGFYAEAAIEGVQVSVDALKLLSGA